MKRATSIVGALCILATPLSAFAIHGGEAGGGGVGYLCPGNPAYGEPQKVYLADTYDLVRAGKIAGIEHTDPTVIIVSAATLLDLQHPEMVFDHPYNKGEKVTLGWMVVHRYANLAFTYDGSQPLLNDDHIPASDVPANCQKVQVAIQDLHRGRVHLDMDLEQKMSFAERGFFELHETLIAMRDQPGADTTPIREAVNAILSAPGFSFAQLALASIKPDPPAVDLGPIPVSQFLHQNCYPFVQRWEDSIPERLKNEIECQAAFKEENRLWHLQDVATALPTLLHIPKTLNCHIMNEAHNDLRWRPTDFVIRRLRGSGRPKQSADFYLLKFSRGAGPEELFSKGVDLTTERRQRSTETESYGALRISLMFAGWENPAVILERYVERTNEFVGVIQKTKIPTSSLVAYTSFGISCTSDDIEYGTDTVGSF